MTMHSLKEIVHPDGRIIVMVDGKRVKPSKWFDLCDRTKRSDCFCTFEERGRLIHCKSIEV